VQQLNKSKQVATVMVVTAWSPPSIFRSHFFVGDTVANSILWNWHQNLPFPWGTWTPSNTPVPQPIQIQSAVFPQFTHWTNRPTDSDRWVRWKSVPAPIYGIYALLYYSNAANNMDRNLTDYQCKHKKTLRLSVMKYIYTKLRT